MRTETTETKITIFAENDMVLCDGCSATSVNGKVTAPVNADVSAWQEMPETEAYDLIAANADIEGDEEPTVDAETIEKAAAYDILMGGGQ